jgi:hypothetical protein
LSASQPINSLCLTRGIKVTKSKYVKIVTMVRSSLSSGSTISARRRSSRSTTSSAFVLPNNPWADLLIWLAGGQPSKAGKVRQTNIDDGEAELAFVARRGRRESSRSYRRNSSRNGRDSQKRRGRAEEDSDSTDSESVLSEMDYEPPRHPGPWPPQAPRPAGFGPPPPRPGGFVPPPPPPGWNPAHPPPPPPPPHPHPQTFG